ncbi:MAG: hypothetical protein RMM08_12655 [Armatimonadota bacterium]|nr:hypothetical protein [bacterium]MDW8322201.1 hypothetical protein [Armatimonadota bacterium]
MTEEKPYPKRVLCLRCRFYDRERHRCTIGKVNPRTKLDTYETVQVLGVRALCSFNLYRDQLLSKR